MINSLTTSLMRVTLFWYVVGMLVLFIGDPQWAETCYARLSMYPWAPELVMTGLTSAARVQIHLLLYWTIPVLGLWALAIAVSFAVSEAISIMLDRDRVQRLKPSGKFWGVHIPTYSLGSLVLATGPKLTGAPVALPGTAPLRDKRFAHVGLDAELTEVVKLLTPDERQLCEELLQLLYADPHHFAGHGHGVGLLEHTFNVVTEAAGKCTKEFRLPVIAALAHDVGKLISFQPDGKGGWKRQGLHSREGARILATLPAFQALPDVQRNALLLAVKYDHAPNKMPSLRGDKEASMLAMRIISALSQADRTATAGEKDRNLVKLQPEDLLWLDFVNFLRDAPIVQRGKKGAANQVNNPPDSPYLYIYEAPWRDAAIPRMPAEVAAALDLTRRDAGKMAKYTRILAERLRRDGLLVEQHGELAVSEANPLWDIQSGTGEKAVVLRGILVIHADLLWKAVNYRLSVKSPFPVQILAPNAGADGAVNRAPAANRDEPRTPDVSDGLKLADVDGKATMDALGLVDAPVAVMVPHGVAQDSDVPSSPVAAVVPGPKPKTRGRFRTPEPAASNDDMLGLTPQSRDAAPPWEAAGSPVIDATPGAPVDVIDALALAMSALQSEPVTAEEPSELMWEEPVDDSPEGNEAPVAPVVVLDAPAATPAPTTPEVKVVAVAPPMAVPAPAPAANKPMPPTPHELSRAEKREGFALADADACLKYPNLTLGDKYYTELSPAVKEGLKKPGARYKGDDKGKQISLSEAGPRRARPKMK